MKRSFKAFGTFAVATMAAAAFAAAPGPNGPPGGAAGFMAMMGSAGKIEQVKDNVYLIPGGGGNTTVFVGSQGVVLVDSKIPGQAKAIIEQVRTVTDKPILYLINTHSHFDHTGSNAEFPATVEIVAHKNLADQLKANPPQGSQNGSGLVKTTYTDHMTLLGGDDTIDLYNFGPAHTNGDTLVVFRKAGVMASGDAFPGKSQPLLDGANGGSGLNIGDFVGKAADTIKGVTLVIPGHSPVATWQDFVDYGEFNRLMLDHARKSLAAGLSSEEALKRFNPPAKFAAYQLGPNMLQQHPAGNFETMYQELKAAQ